MGLYRELGPGHIVLHNKSLTDSTGVVAVPVEGMEAAEADIHLAGDSGWDSRTLCNVLVESCVLVLKE